MDSSSSRNVRELLDGFRAAGGWYDSDLFDLREVPGMGIGAVALRDIPVSSDRDGLQKALVHQLQPDTPLFHVPPTCILTAYTSTLDQVLAGKEWESLNDWSKLILVLMWESARGEDSPWAWYLGQYLVHLEGKLNTLQIVCPPGSLRRCSGQTMPSRT